MHAKNIKYIFMSLMFVVSGTINYSLRAVWYWPEWVFGAPVVVPAPVVMVNIERRVVGIEGRVELLELHNVRNSFSAKWRECVEQCVELGSSITPTESLQAIGLIGALYITYGFYSLKRTELWLRSPERWAEWYCHCKQKQEVAPLLFLEIKKVYKVPYSVHAIFAIQLFLKDLALEISACKKYQQSASRLCHCRCKWFLDPQLAISMDERLENLLYIKDTCVHQILTYL